MAESQSKLLLIFRVYKIHSVYLFSATMKTTVFDYTRSQHMLLLDGFQYPLLQKGYYNSSSSHAKYIPHTR